MFKNILKSFPPEREEKLREIERYSAADVYFYRPNLWHHSLRVALIVEKLSPFIKEALPQCDIKKAKVLALVHDDAEIITGDVQVAHKDQMTKEELEKVDNDEAEAIEEISKEYPEEAGGYNYRNLLIHALKKDCIEARVVSYADKVDAFCESMHELLGGNLLGLRPVIGETLIIYNFGNKYPELKPLLEKKESPFIDIKKVINPMREHKERYVHLNRPHTRESIMKETEWPVYNEWKRMVMENLGEEGIEILTTKKESL